MMMHCALLHEALCIELYIVLCIELYIVFHDRSLLLFLGVDVFDVNCVFRMMYRPYRLIITIVWLASCVR